MREEPLRTCLQEHLTDESRDSDASDLSESGIDALLDRLAASGVPARSVGDGRSALRRYTDFLAT
jgi:site-specific recombinase XerC